jgi:hypothetical protein
MAIITLTTDFGLQDEYVGSVKGVIYGIAPQAIIVDVTHGVPAFEIRSASHLLKAVFHSFPRGTIHMAVIDPGVGSDRAILGASIQGHYFLAPDNGLLVPIIRQFGVDLLVAVREQTFFRRPISRTFHGRDIFAPVAAHLSQGQPLSRFGPLLEPGALDQPAWSDPLVDEAGQLIGHVVWIDRFGNLITDIHLDHLAELGANESSRSLHISAGPHKLTGLAASYTQGFGGKVLAIIGSRNCLEIAVDRGSAAKTLGLYIGAEIQVSRVPAA